jgi:hypothetical protein
MKIIHRFIFTILILSFSIPFIVSASEIVIDHSEKGYHVKFQKNREIILKSDSKGLWKIATRWQDDWPVEWEYFHPQHKIEKKNWIILKGQYNIQGGVIEIQDAYQLLENKIKCTRRYEWKGKKPLEKITLSINWQSNAKNNDVLLPGILYYGNPSGEKNGKNRVPVFHGNPGEIAIFEEHRYSMPFASLEWQQNGSLVGAAIHTTPSLVPYSGRDDQWWSLGVAGKVSGTELQLLSGPCAYNGKKGVVKALQRDYLPYPDTYMNLPPGAIVEKTFFIEVYKVDQKGSGFIRPINTSLETHKPYFGDNFPAFNSIIESKMKFAKTRWLEDDNFSGFCMYPAEIRKEIVMGWCGQAATPGYAMQLLGNYSKNGDFNKYIQQSMDFLSNSPVNDKGLKVRYSCENDKWSGQDFVSQGQAMYNFAKAIQIGRQDKQLKTEKWEEFLKQTSAVHSKRILSNEWHPISTNEGFLAAPLFLAGKLFDNRKYHKAALQIVEHYGERHLSMDEPYWGGTLDATCEDKEGAWAGFQAFLAAYEHTGQKKYLEWAEHAAYVTLSYTVTWNIPMPPGRLSDHFFKSQGWTVVSPQNQHLDVYGVLIAPSIYKLGQYTKDDRLQQLAKVMYRSCGQLIDYRGSQGEQIQHTNFAQRGEMSDVNKLRGGYSEDWTVFWITAHFLNAAAQFQELNVIK